MKEKNKVYKELEVLAEAGFKFALYTKSNIGFEISTKKNEESIYIYPEKGNMSLAFNSDWKKPNSYDIKSMYESRSWNPWTDLALSKGDSLKEYHLYSGKTEPRGKVLSSSEIFDFMNYIQPK